jgi:RimJ/RimL family protein N-acetyltransferase
MTKRGVTARSDTPCLTLHDGRVVEARPLEPRDRAGLAAAVRRLSDETRYLRFASPKPELTERELDFLFDVDHHSREAILAVDPSTGHGVGVVRYVEVPGEPGVVEIAATVADDWQGRGLGRALLEQLTSRARDEGYSTLRANVLAINRRSINMLRRAGFAPHAGSGIQVTLPSRPGTHRAMAWYTSTAVVAAASGWWYSASVAISISPRSIAPIPSGAVRRQ